MLKFKKCWSLSVAYAAAKFFMTCALMICVLTPARAEEAAVAEKPAAAGLPTKKSAKEAAKKTPEKKVEPQWIKLAKGTLLLPVPGNWKAGKPRNRIIHHEFSIPAAQGDATPGRMTIMPSGGGVEANIARWIGQYKTEIGKPLGDDAKKVTQKKVGDLTIHLVDVTGVYQDSPRGPFGPKVQRPGYRMLGAILPTKKNGVWFVKFYGPKATIKAAEKTFDAMLEGVKLAP